MVFVLGHQVGDIFGLEEKLEEVESAVFVESLQRLLHGPLLPLQLVPQNRDPSPQAGQLGRCFFHLDVVQVEFGLDEGFVEKDALQGGEDGLFLLLLFDDPPFDLFDLPADAEQALVEAGGVLAGRPAEKQGRRQDQEQNPSHLRVT
jgi:hypothetical protein